MAPAAAASRTAPIRSLLDQVLAPLLHSCSQRRPSPTRQHRRRPPSMSIHSERCRRLIVSAAVRSVIPATSATAAGGITRCCKPPRSNATTAPTTRSTGCSRRLQPSPSIRYRSHVSRLAKPRSRSWGSASKS